MTDLPTLIAKMPTAEKITADWGERCPDHDGDCFCCQMWAAHDAVSALLGRVEELERELTDTQTANYCMNEDHAALKAKSAKARAEALEEAAKLIERLAPTTETEEALLPVTDDDGEVIGHWHDPAGKKKRFITGERAAAAIRSLSTAEGGRTGGQGEASEQKEIILLHIIADMGGKTDSGDYPWNWLNWFCNDDAEGGGTDTFNRCEAKGWIRTTHDSDTDSSTTTLTAAGRAALATRDGGAE